MSSKSPTATALTLFSLTLCATVTNAQTIDFNRDVRPILSGKCFTCHGPDDEARKAGLRLDTRDTAVKPLKNGKTAITPANPATSELIRRITTDDEDDLMPPSKAGAPLTPRQIVTLKQWITEGANYAQHWSYTKPTRRPFPTIQDKTWPKNPIDRFILARLEKDALRP